METRVEGLAQKLESLGVHKQLTTGAAHSLDLVGVNTIDAGFVVDRDLLARIGDGKGVVWLATDSGLVSLTINSQLDRGVRGLESPAKASLVPWGSITGMEYQAEISFEHEERITDLTLSFLYPKLEKPISASNRDADDYAGLMALAAVVVRHMNEKRGT